jgi:hypothetical protein
MFVRNGGALILQPHIRHAGDAGNARAQFAKLLSYVAILPWVRVPQLASHVLSQISRRIRQDWQAKYGQPVWLLETFVDRHRFAGTCYRAANWICLGQTQGRGRQGPSGRLSTPIKDVYVWPLHRNFRRDLNPVDTDPHC